MADSVPIVERRKYQRICLSLKGQLFDPEEGTQIDCKLTDLSGGGAGLESECEIPHGKHLILYIEGFGRYEGSIVIHNSGKPAMHFTIGELKRKRLIELLHQFVCRGSSGGTELHQFARAPSSFKDEIVRENGDRLRCDILDISLEGVSLKTEERPSIGEIVTLGRSLGQVVRHHPRGIAIQYVKEVSS